MPQSQEHCQNGTVEFLLETISLCKKLTDKPLLVRLDSGNDSIDNVAVLIDTGCSFIIKRNLRKKSRDEWFQMAKTQCKDITTPREGKTVYIGSDWKEVTSQWFEKDFTLRTGYEILVKIANEKDTEIREQEKEIEDKANKKDTEKREFNWKLVGGISFAVVQQRGYRLECLAENLALSFLRSKEVLIIEGRLFYVYTKRKKSSI